MECRYCKRKITGRTRQWCNRKCYEKDYFSRPENKRKNAIWSYRHKLRKIFNLSKDEYNKITKKCSVNGCNWKHHIEIHHKDQNKNNNNKSNFVALCPNHHRLLHLSGLLLSELSKY